MIVISEAYANARMDAFKATVGVSPKVRLFTGDMPATTADADTGTMITEYTLASDWIEDASAGAVTLKDLPINGTAVAAGAPGYLRIYENDGTTCHKQMIAGISGDNADVTVSSANVSIGEAINIIDATWTDGNA